VGGNEATPPRWGFAVGSGGFQCGRTGGESGGRRPAASPRGRPRPYTPQSTPH
jgi:hypothetical protein